MLQTCQRSIQGRFLPLSVLRNREARTVFGLRQIFARWRSVHCWLWCYTVVKSSLLSRLWAADVSRYEYLSHTATGVQVARCKYEHHMHVVSAAKISNKVSVWAWHYASYAQRSSIWCIVTVSPQVIAQNF